MALKRLMRYGFERTEDAFDAMFGSNLNPLHQLGALGWYFYWIVVVSGIYLYIFFDTGVTEAYESVEILTHNQWYAGGVMRSLHRYASDALVIVVLIHLLREFATDRLRGKRWFAWFTGVPLLWFIYACGITGYWLVWDQLAQYVAIATSEWLDALPIFGEPIARNFLNSANLSGRFFTLMVYIHIFVPLLMLFIMWVHIQRHAQPKVNPPRALAAGTLVVLVVLSLVHPALSQGPADLDQVPAVIDLDWYYLAAYPLLEVMGGGKLWAILGAATLLLLLLPWMPPKRKEVVAVVDLENCNGCGRCHDDCPFSAITMEPRSDGLSFEQEAVVNVGLCTSCGVCVGACPTATPFRRVGPLIPGIELPDYGVSDLRQKIVSEAENLAGASRVIVFGCHYGARLDALEGPSVAVMKLPCVGMLPPSFIDFVISRGYADGVFLAGCRGGDCYYRLGIEWTEQRLAGSRDPYLRKRVPRERLATSWSGLTQVTRRRRELERFRERLEGLERRTTVVAEADDQPLSGETT